MSIIHPGYIKGVFVALPNPTIREVEALEDMGIPADSLAGPSPIRSASVHFEGDHFVFDHHCPSDGCARAFVFLTTNSWDEAVDIVAWSPSSDRLATWLGRAWALGEETIDQPRLTEHGALSIWRSPVGWLGARQHGICLVRPRAAAHYLADTGPLLAEDAEHGIELKMLLTRPAPRILVSASNFKGMP